MEGSVVFNGRGGNSLSRGGGSIRDGGEIGKLAMGSGVVQHRMILVWV